MQAASWSLKQLQQETRKLQQKGRVHAISKLTQNM